MACAAAAGGTQSRGPCIDHSCPSSPCCSPRPPPRRLLPPARDLRPQLLDGEQCFFERPPGIAYDPPHRTVARPHTPVVQLDNQSPQRQVRNRLQPTQQPFPLTRQRALLLAPHRPRRSAPGRPQPLRPLHRARHTHSKQPCRLPGRSARDNRPSHALPKIVRIGSRHPCWPPSPASRSNQNSPNLRSPQRFNNDEATLGDSWIRKC